MSIGTENKTLLTQSCRALDLKVHATCKTRLLSDTNYCVTPH